MAKLPPLSEERYIEQANTQEIVHQEKDSKMDNEKQGNKQTVTYEATCEVSVEYNSQRISETIHELSRDLPATVCLFCNLQSTTLAANLDHMSTLHGLFIPLPEQLLDLESFLGFLAVIIFDYHECLFCGLSKYTVGGVQTHMRDKGHCMINMNKGSELLDFWESHRISSEDHTEGKGSPDIVKLSGSEIKLSSGVLISSRPDPSHFHAKPVLAQMKAKYLQSRIRRTEMKRMPKLDQQKAEAKQSTHSRGNDNHIALRSEMGLLGIPDSQKRGLQIIEKRMKRSEADAVAAYRHSMEQQPIKTKYYKTEAPIYQAG